MDDFRAGNIDQVFIGYQRFVNAGSQRPTIRQLLPIVAPEGTASAPVDFIFEPSPQRLLETLLPRFVEMQVYEAVLEARASEQSARMVAMKSATDNAGNVINEDVLASLEYAALHTGAPLIVIMGHSGCGAVKAAIDQHATESLSENLTALLQRLAPAVKAARQQTNAPEQLLVQAVRANVLQSCGLARKQSELLRHLEAQGYLSIVPAIYQLQSGDIEWLPDATRPLQQAVAAPSGESAQKPEGTPETDHALHSAAPIKLANAEHSNETATTKNPELDWAQESNLPNTQLQTDNAPHANSLLAALDDQRGYWFAGLGFSSALLGAWLLIRKKSA
ncbi:MAG: F0F1 ATP synthase subunit gamma, partial [Planctomycetota bacterium]